MFERDTAASEVQVRLVFVLVVESRFLPVGRRLRIFGGSSFTAVFQFIEFQSEQRRVRQLEGLRERTVLVSGRIRAF